MAYKLTLCVRPGLNITNHLLGLGSRLAVLGIHASRGTCTSMYIAQGTTMLFCPLCSLGNCSCFA